MIKARYPVTDYNNIRGILLLIHRNEHGQEKAFVLIESLDTDMTEVTDPKEISMMDQALNDWRDAAIVTRFQAKSALHQSGLLEQVQSYIANSDDMMLKLAWDESLFKRNSSMIKNVGSALGLTEEQKDDLFRLAASIGD